MLLKKILVQCEASNLLQGKNKQRTDATHILAAVRHRSQLELVGETVRRMLDAMAQVDPDWLRARMQPEWIKRYGRGFEDYRLPKTREKLLGLACTHLQQVATAAAINVVRSVNWLTGEVPEPTRVSPFQALAAL